MFVHSTPSSSMSTLLTHSQSLRLLLLYDESSTKVSNRQRIRTSWVVLAHYPAGSQGKNKTALDLVWVHDYPLPPSPSSSSRKPPPPPLPQRQGQGQRDGLGAHLSPQARAGCGLQQPWQQRVCRVPEQARRPEAQRSSTSSRLSIETPEAVSQPR